MSKQADEELIEKLAAIEHERWADWQKWVHSLMGLLVGSDGNDTSLMAIDKAYVDRWNRQIETPYDSLSEEEKQSDRDQVMRYYHLVEQRCLEARIDESTPNAANEGTDQVRVHVPQRDHFSNNEYDKGWNDCWNAFWTARWERVGNLATLREAQLTNLQNKEEK